MNIIFQSAVHPVNQRFFLFTAPEKPILHIMIEGKTIPRGGNDFMYYGMRPISYAAMNNFRQHPYNLNHPEGKILHNSSRQDKNSSPGTGHTHAFDGATTCNDGHTHLHPGVTGTPIESNESHVHKVYGNTTFDDNHIHEYEAYTGPPIPLANGYHTHFVEIRTTESDGHTHVIKGFTAASKS